MYVVQSETAGLAFSFVTLLCWGVWSISFKVASSKYHVRTHIFMGQFVFWCAIAALVYGSILGDDLLWHDGDEEQQFWRNLLHAITPTSAFFCFVAGMLAFLGNLLLLVGVELAGLAIAFPLTLSIAVVGGTTVNYVINPEGTLYLIALGVVSAVIAIACAAVAHFSMMSRKKTILHSKSVQEDPGFQLDGGSLHGAGCCAVAATFFSIWPTFELYACETNADLQPVALSPYVSFFLMTLGGMVSIAFVIVVDLVVKRFYGDSNHDETGREETFDCPAAQHERADAEDIVFSPIDHALKFSLPCLGGFVWSTGTLANLIAADRIGFAVSYFLAQASVVVTTMLGIVLWREFDGSPRIAKVGLVLFFTFYGIAVGCIMFSE